MELGTRTSSEKYNPITGTPIPVHPTRPNTSAIFGGSPGNIEYMFLPPSATTRPTIPTTTIEKRRSLSRESLRRSLPSTSEGQPDSDECSSISDVSECSSEAEPRERTRTNSGSYSRTRKPVTRSVSSRLPVSTTKPCVMKRANSFTRGTGSCVPRGQTSDTRGTTNTTQEATTLTTNVNSQAQRPSVEGGSKIPRKTNPGPRAPGPPQSSRIPLKRADVNSNVAEREAERTGTESTVNKRTAPADSKPRGIPVATSNKQTSTEPCKSEAVTSKQSAVSGIPVKGGKGNSKLPQAKPDGPGSRVRESAANKMTEQTQNIDKENDDIKGAMQDGKSALKREGTGDELRVAKTDVTKSKIARKSNIPKSNIAKPSQLKTRNNSSTESETKPQKINQTAQNAAHRDLSTRPAEATSLNTSSTLQRSDSGYGDTDSVSSKEDVPAVEAGNEFSLSRENSKSKIPIKSWKNRGTAKPNREAPNNDEKPKAVTKKSDNANGNESLNAARKILEAENGTNKPEGSKISDTNDEAEVTCENLVSNNATSQADQEHDVHNKTSENISSTTKTDNITASSKENLAGELETTVPVTSQTASRGSPVEEEAKEISKEDKSGSLRETRDCSDEKTLPESGTPIPDERALMSNGFSVACLAPLGHEHTLKDFEEKQERSTVKDAEKKRKDVVSIKQEIETSSAEQTKNNLRSLDEETASKRNVQQNNDEGEKASRESLEDEQEVVVRKKNLKQSPRKPPRLSKISVQDESWKKQEASLPETRQESGDGSRVERVEVGGVGVNEEEVGGVGVHGDDVGVDGGVGVDRDGVGVHGDVEDNEKPHRKSENCMQCRMEQSMIDGETLPKLDDDPGFRQYPTFISPRKSLVMCKHHAKQKDDTEMARDEVEKPLISMTSLPTVNNENISKLKPFQTRPEQNSKILDMSSQDRPGDINNEANAVGVKSPIGENSREISPKSNKAENLPSLAKTMIKDRSESLKTPATSREVQAKNLPGPKGSHSPLLALSRDKKFASSSKPTEDIKTALSLEWDDTGTELSPPNFSDDDEEFSGPGAKQDIEDKRGPSVKLMNTNEALDKLKVIQSLIMKEAESRSRKESDESDGKYAVGVKKTGTELVEGAGNAGKITVDAKKAGNESEQISPTLEGLGRKMSSPTIWDRINTEDAISQDQTTELLNETLAKLKASPKLSSNAFARRTLSSRSLPGSRQASKEQLLSDGERPVYVYTSNWMNRSGKNSRGSSLSLCSANRSLPSSRQNLTKEPFNALKRSESAAGRMEKENGKFLEPKERKEFRLSDFDEINLSDDGMTELKSHKPTPDEKKSAEKDGKMLRQPIKRSKRRKKTKNTAATTSDLPPYGVSMEDLNDGKTTCKCGAKGCVIS